MRSTRRPMLLVLFALLLARLTPSAHADESDIEIFLGRPILSPDVAFEEVQAYVEQRIPPMPAAASVEEWEKLAEQLRRDTLDKVVFRGEASVWRHAPTKVEWLDTIEGGPGYRIKKLRYEALPGLWIPALLYEPEKLADKAPVSLNVNGHDPQGKAAVYKQIRCINQAKRGMLALNVEWLGMGQLRGAGYGHGRMNQLDLCGTSGLAPFYLAMQRGLDLLLALPHADPQRVAVSGLSGGGWQTIIISALDTRVTLSNPVAGYSSFRTRVRHHSDLGDSEQTPVDLGAVADYAQLTMMRAPRPTLLTYNVKDDCCFASGHALPPLLEAARPIFKLYGREDALHDHINHDPGTHNFEKDNREAFYRMLTKFFSAPGNELPPGEIDCQAEVKTAEQLSVPLPADNADFNKLASSLAKTLPRAAEPPADKSQLREWRAGRRRQLADIVRAKTYGVNPQQMGSETKADVTATLWKLQLDRTWTVPAVELVRGEPKGTTLVIADGGRKNAAEQVEKLLAAGQRVLALDPFYFGEAKVPQRDYLFALLISTIGDRPLGVQASQFQSVAKWASVKWLQPVGVVAVGPRTSVVALVAGGLEVGAIAKTETVGARASLKELIEQNVSVEAMPEQFCFGLLEQFDIPQLVALATRLPPDAAAAVEADVSAAVAVSAPATEDWPEFRGPTGQGHARAVGLPTEWSDTKNVAWKQPIPGLGWSSPALVGGRLYLTTAVVVAGSEDHSLRALCLDAGSGRILWNEAVFNQPVDAPRIHGKNSHASPSPLVAGNRVFVHFGHQGTACLDLTGKLVWKNAELKYAPVHGNGGTPVLVDDALIFSCDGGADPFIVALDAATGRVRWKTPRAGDAVKKFSFSTPLVITVQGQTQVISPGSDSVSAFDPKSGREIWRVNYDGYSVIPRPVFGHGLVFLSTGYNPPSVLAIRPDGTGDVTETHVAWTVKKGAPHTPSLLLVGDELFMVSDGGIATCLDAKTGEEIWQERIGGKFSSSPLFNGGLIYLQSEEGVGTVFKAARAFELIATNPLNERTLASYAVGDGAIFVRTEKQLFRIEQR